METKFFCFNFIFKILFNSKFIIFEKKIKSFKFNKLKPMYKNIIFSLQVKKFNSNFKLPFYSANLKDKGIFLIHHQIRSCFN
jgi:hypothetical protein